MAHDWEDSTDSDTGDELNDFDSFLREKDKQWTKPAQELKPTDLIAVPNLDETFEIIPAAGAVESLSDEPKSTGTVESTSAPTSTSAASVESVGSDDISDAPSLERVKEITLHSHPIRGTYVTEEMVAYRLDPTTLELFNKAKQVGVNDLSLEEIIIRIHKIQAAYKKLRSVEGGYTTAMAIKMQRLNDEDQAKYRKMHHEEGLKHQTRTRIERVKKSSGSAPAKAKSLAKTASQKQVDVLKKNGLDKEFIINQLKTTKRLDAATLAYIEKLVW